MKKKSYISCHLLCYDSRMNFKKCVNLSNVAEVNSYTIIFYLEYLNQINNLTSSTNVVVDRCGANNML